MTTSTPTKSARKAGGLLLWFGALGGALAWAVHLIAAWGIVELTCVSGHRSLGDVPIRAAVAIGVVVPAVVTLASLLVSWRAWRQASRAERGDDPRMQRTGLVALIGVCADLLFLTIIIAGGAAVLVFQPCQ